MIKTIFLLSLLDVLLAVVVIEFGSLQSSVPQHSPDDPAVSHMSLVLHAYTPKMIEHLSNNDRSPQTVCLAFSFVVPT